MKVAYSSGEREINVGDQFAFAGGDRWEVVRLASVGMHSPYGLGGTPCFACKSIDEFPRAMLDYVEDDGTVIFCGDSIAAAMARTAASNPDSRDGK